MFFGILAIVQAVFLPGFLAMRLTRVKTGSLIETAILALALSLLVNYLLVFAMTVIGAYGRPAVLALGAVEVGAALALMLKSRGEFVREGVRFRFPAVRSDRWLAISMVSISVAVLAAAAAAALSAAFRFNVFDGWDSLFEWNRWAYDWYHGTIPRPTYTYPQLVPAVWSMMYLISGSAELQCFPLTIMPFFGVGILAMFLDLGLRRRRIEYLVGLLLCTFIFWHWRGLLFASGAGVLGGYVDLPLTFMMMAAFYQLELAKTRLPANWRELSMPLILASTAAVTKMSGAYALAVVLVLGLVGHLRARPSLPPREWLRSGAYTLATLAVIPGTWWGMKALDLAAGRDMGNYFSDLESARTFVAGSGGPAQRFTHAAGLFPGAGEYPGSPVVLAAVGVAVLLSLGVRRARWVVLGILVPYSLVWVYFLSYDLRNWLPMVPVTAYAAAIGACSVAQRWRRVDLRLAPSSTETVLGPRVVGGAVAILLSLIAILSVVWPSSKLVAGEVGAQRSIGNPYLNEMLYSTLWDDASLRGEILTDYRYLQLLPDFRSTPYRLRSSDRFHVVWLHENAVTVDALRDRDILVLSDLASKEVVAAVETGIEQGDYSVLAQYDSEYFGGGYGPSAWKVRVIRVNHRGES